MRVKTNILINIIYRTQKWIQILRVDIRVMLNCADKLGTHLCPHYVYINQANEAINALFMTTIIFETIIISKQYPELKNISF